MQMNNQIQPYLDDIVNGYAQLDLKITDDNNNYVGEMRPLTINHLDQPDILLKLTDWRNHNMAMFLSQFHATIERTKNWLENIVFRTPGQMLFLIYENDLLIGHLGFKSLTVNNGVLDNAIRGEKTLNPKIFVYAHKALARWLFSEAKIQCLYGYVLTDNVAAIMMNRQIGWSGWVRHPLLKNSSHDEITWQVGEENQPSPDDKYCFKIVLYSGL